MIKMLFILIVIACIVIKYSVELKRDTYYDNIRCKNIIIEELYTRARSMPNDKFSAKYRVSIASKHIAMDRNIDRRVLVYYKNNKDFIDNYVMKILTNNYM